MGKSGPLHYNFALLKYILYCPSPRPWSKFYIKFAFCNVDATLCLVLYFCLM